MATSIRTRDSDMPGSPYTGLPDIISLNYGIRTYQPPLRRFTGIFEMTLFHEAVEFIIRTDKPIPAQGSAPALYIGNLPVIDIELVKDTTYICRLFDYKNLPEFAAIYWGWSYAPENKMETRFEFNRKDLKRF